MGGTGLDARRGAHQSPVDCAVAVGTWREGLADTQRDLLPPDAVTAVDP